MSYTFKLLPGDQVQEIAIWILEHDLEYSSEWSTGKSYFGIITLHDDDDIIAFKLKFGV